MNKYLFLFVTLLLVTPCIKPSIDPTNWEDKDYNDTGVEGYICKLYKDSEIIKEQ